MIWSNRENILKYEIYKNGFSIESIDETVSLLLSEISTKLNITNNWHKQYISVRLRKPRASAAIVLRATNGDLDLAVKYFVRKPSDRTLGEINEYDHLQQVFNSLPAQNKYKVPRPVHAVRDAYAVDWIDMPSMKSQLVWARFISPKRLSCLEAAARNLKLIHQTAADGDRPLDLSMYISAARRSGTSAPSWKHNFNCFIEVSQRFEGVPVLHCRLHGDYSPENLLFSKEKIATIDFAHDHVGPIYHDMCHCVMYFSFYCSNIFSNTFNLLRSDMNAFRLAYSGIGAPVQNDVFMLMQWAVILTRWGRHEVKSRDPQRSSSLRALDWYFARQLEVCCLKLQEALSSD